MGKDYEKVEVSVVATSSEDVIRTSGKPEGEWDMNTKK